MENYLHQLESEFRAHADPTNAASMEAYMKNHFVFLGIKAPLRRQLLKPFLAQAYLPPKAEMKAIVHTLWTRPEREYHYAAVELAQKYNKQNEHNDIQLFEHLIINNSWWDTVDFIATHLVGTYLKEFPERKKELSQKWLTSNNRWLQRTALLFQLKYKDQLDTQLLSNNIEYLLGSKEFFINKAIGWILREYAKTNPLWVKDFVNQHELSNLSRREALKHF